MNKLKKPYINPTREITSDHILFNECINEFRPEYQIFPFSTKSKYKSIILLPFHLTQIWDLGICVVHPSSLIKLSGPYFAHISVIDNPEWAAEANPHLFATALSAIISFITYERCKANRDDFLRIKGEIFSYEQMIALTNPILIEGLGTTQTILTNERLTSYCKEIKLVVELLFKIDIDSYWIAMQSIRLTHLSILNKREDLGLAYLLIVSSIEAIAQKTISTDDVKENHPSLLSWPEKAEYDSVFKELLGEYKVLREKAFLKKKYVKFIQKYAPVSDWEVYVPHPFQISMENIKDFEPTFDVGSVLQKPLWDKYPTDYTGSELEKILEESYNHRSAFVHEGKQPPHRDPFPILNRFFQEMVNDNYPKSNSKIVVLPNYELLLGIVKLSLINWLTERSLHS